MKQDRKLNGWILTASILGIVAGFILIAGGATLAILGFLKPEQISKIEEIVFFLNQKGIMDFQLKILKNRLIVTEYLYLFSGIIVAIIGLLGLIFGIVAFRCAKKRKVVGHKVAILLSTLIPLIVAGSAITYLVLEKEMFDLFIDLNIGFGKNIMYVTYGVAGIFGLIVLCNILGIVFGRSEKFMSNDNSKYSFDNSNMPDTKRDNIRNNSSRQMTVNKRQSQVQNPDQARQTQAQSSRPMQGSQVRTAQRTAQSQPIQSTRPQPMVRPQSQMVRPNMQQSSQSVRPAQQQGVRPQGTQPTLIRRQIIRRCPRCGKVLNPNERVCTMCGYKIAIN